MATRAYKPPKNLVGLRLDSVLSKMDDSYSRSSWQKLIRLACVKVDGRPAVDPSAKYSGGLIEFEPPGFKEDAPEVLVIYQDEDVIVYDKPAGLLTHAKGELPEEWTLADLVRPLVEDDDINRPGIVHRLDRATSGVIIVARNLKAKKMLQKQFSQRRVAKTYQAIVHGKITEDSLTIDLPIARDPKKPKQFTVSSSGKSAQTALKTVAEAGNYTWVELRPKTGRTHQLRVHLSAIGHPIVGDEVYGDDQAGRLFLHASRLELTLPSGQQRDFESALPPDFKQGLEDYGLI